MIIPEKHSCIQLYKQDFAAGTLLNGKELQTLKQQKKASIFAN